MYAADSFRHIILIGAALFALLGCATTPQPEINEPWMEEVLNYDAVLGDNHKDSVENLFNVTPEISATVLEKFGKLPDFRAVRKLAMWLIDEDGKGMNYDVEANLIPQQAYLENRGNCLSFTLLLMQLAGEIGIELKVNEVDLPNFWSENEEQDLVFYRHVNAVYRDHRQTQIFDLAMEDYDEGYPQRIIGKRQASALLFSNIGIQKLQQKEVDQALHYLKLAVSMSPKNSDLWINLAAALKRTEHPERAEQAYLRAVSLNDRDSIAASNLERLYRSKGRMNEAKQYKKLAQRARRKNPYIHFRKAQTALKNNDFSTARKSIRRAINLHDEDPQFFALRSVLKQAKEDYIGALRDMERAHNMSRNLEQRGRYANKVDRVLAHIKQQAEEHQKRNKGNISFDGLPTIQPRQL